MVSQELLLRQPTTSFDLHKNYSIFFANILKAEQANRLALRGQHIRKYDQGNSLTRPSQESMTNLLRRIHDVIRNNLHVAPGILVWMLNPILRGWANYHRHAASEQTFQKIDGAIFQSLWKRRRRRHPYKLRPWIKEKYFRWFTVVSHLAERRW